MAMDDLNSQAFWNEFMRRPDAKEAYQSEKRLQAKSRRGSKRSELLKSAQNKGKK